MNTDEYELLPHQQIQKLREEVDRLKYKHGKDEKDHDEFYASIENLNKSISKLLRIFERVEEELQGESNIPKHQLEKFNKFEHISEKAPLRLSDAHLVHELKEKNKELYNEIDLLKQRIEELSEEIHTPKKQEVHESEEQQITGNAGLPLIPSSPDSLLEEPINPRPIQEPSAPTIPISGDMQKAEYSQQQKYEQVAEPQNIHDAIEMKIQQQRQQISNDQQQIHEIPKFNAQQIKQNKQYSSQNIQQKQIENQNFQDNLRKQEQERIEIQERYAAQKLKQMTQRQEPLLKDSVNISKVQLPHQASVGNMQNYETMQQSPQQQNLQQQGFKQNMQPPNFQQTQSQQEDMPLPLKPQRMQYDPYEVQRMQQQKQQTFSNQSRPSELMQQPPNETFVDPGFPTAQNFQPEVPPGQTPEITAPIDVKPTKKKKFMGLF